MFTSGVSGQGASPFNYQLTPAQQQQANALRSMSNAEAAGDQARLDSGVLKSKLIEMSGKFKGIDGASSQQYTLNPEAWGDIKDNKQLNANIMKLIGKYTEGNPETQTKVLNKLAKLEIFVPSNPKVGG